jgi:hypothetical protein
VRTEKDSLHRSLQSGVPIREVTFSWESFAQIAERRPAECGGNAVANFEVQVQGVVGGTPERAEVNGKYPDLSGSQRKALARLLEAEPKGFAGGMSTEKYVNLTGTSRATAYRELTHLTEYGILARTGQGRGPGMRW